MVDKSGRPHILNRALSNQEIEDVYQYERYFFLPWWKQIILAPRQLWRSVFSNGAKIIRESECRTNGASDAAE